MTDAKAWLLERDAQGIATLTFDRPSASANTLGRPALEELGARIDELANDPPRGLIVRSGKPSGFIAGADIREFTTLRSEAEAYELIHLGQHVLERLEALPCPSVAAIQGFALGGGLELALACHYRVCADDGKLSLGFPEVMLGIHPGFGGTVRSVRNIGVRAAMPLILTGKPVRAAPALAMGLVDRLVPPARLLEAARELLLAPPPRRTAPLADRLLNLPGVRQLMRGSLEARVARQAPRQHYPAPYAIIDLWVRHGAGVAGYEAEARSIAALFLSETARGLVRMFLLQDRLKGLGGKAASPPKHVHVIGAGVMGGDIAAWCALRGLEVTLQDRELKYIEPALARAGKLFEKRISDPAARAKAGARLRADVAAEGVATADVLIEAIFEDLGAKRALYDAVVPRLPAASLLATNTSSITLEQLSANLPAPGRLVGLHFFNPVAQMPLVEVIHAEGTDPAAIDTALAFARRIDKLPLPCRSGPGFLVNRILFPYLTEAMLAAAEGVPLEVIDEVATRFGMPMGPIELADTVGLDVALHVGRVLSEAFGTPRPTVLEPRVAAGELGRKSGQGLYRWQDGRPIRAKVTSSAPNDLEDRLVLAMVNEAAACLREGIVADEDLLDAGVIFGTGFAPFRGGPLQYARSRGIPKLIARLEGLAQAHGSHFRPDPGWQTLA